MSNQLTELHSCLYAAVCKGFLRRISKDTFQQNLKLHQKSSKTACKTQKKLTCESALESVHSTKMFESRFRFGRCRDTSLTETPLVDSRPRVSMVGNKKSLQSKHSKKALRELGFQCVYSSKRVTVLCVCFNLQTFAVNNLTTDLFTKVLCYKKCPWECLYNTEEPYAFLLCWACVQLKEVRLYFDGAG